MNMNIILLFILSDNMFETSRKVPIFFNKVLNDFVVKFLVCCMDIQYDSDTFTIAHCRYVDAYCIGSY